MKHAYLKQFTTVTPLSKALAFYLFILLPILAFYVGVGYQKQIQQITPPPSLLPSMSPSPTVVPFNWFTYVNLTYGFSFQYPSYLSVICCEVAGPLSDTSERILSFVDKDSAQREGKPFDGLGVYIDQNPTHLSFNQYVNREYGSLYRAYPRFSGANDSIDTNLKKTAETIGSSPAISIQGQFTYPYENVYVPFPDNQRILILAKLLRNSSSGFTNVWQKMFTTFRFLSPIEMATYEKRYKGIGAQSSDFVQLPRGVVLDSSSSALLDKQ